MTKLLQSLNTKPSKASKPMWTLTSRIIVTSYIIKCVSISKELLYYSHNYECYPTKRGTVKPLLSGQHGSITMLHYHSYLVQSTYKLTQMSWVKKQMLRCAPPPPPPPPPTLPNVHCPPGLCLHMSTHISTIIVSQQSDPVRLSSSAIVHDFFFSLLLVHTSFCFSIFSIQSGCDRSGWRWNLVLKHLHIASRPEVGPTYVDSKRSL